MNGSQAATAKAAAGILMGDVSDYTPELATLICDELASGRTLRSVCRDPGMPHESTVRKWANEDREGFHTQYTRAREIGYHAMADETVEIADDGANDWMERHDGENVGWKANGEHIQRSRLRVDTRKWLLSKALPKVFGEKVTHAGDPENPLIPEVSDLESARQIAFLLTRAMESREG